MEITSPKSGFSAVCVYWLKQGKPGGLIAATGLVILLKLESNRQFFSPCDLEILWMTSKKIGHLFYDTSSFVHQLQSGMLN